MPSSYTQKPNTTNITTTDQQTTRECFTKRLCIIIMSFHISIAIPREWGPQYYHHTFDGRRPQMTHAIKELPRLHIQGDELILDVGCGDGEMAAYIAHHFLSTGTIHGIDISPSMIDAAQQRYASQNIIFESISLLDYQPKKQYDIVVCFWTLYLVNDYFAGLKKLTSFLKPNGKALICHIIDPGTPFFQLLKSTISPEQIPLRFPTLESIITALHNVPVFIDFLKVEYNYDRHATCADFLSGMQKIPLFDHLMQSLSADFYIELSKLYPQQGDGFVYDYAHVITLILEKNEGSV